MRSLSLLLVVLAVACMAMAAPAPKNGGGGGRDNDDRHGGNNNANNNANRTTTTRTPRTTATHVPRTENATRLGEVVNCSLSVVQNVSNADADAFRTCVANVTSGRSLRSCVRALLNTTTGNDTTIVNGLRSCAGLPPACNSSVNATAALQACVDALNSTAADVIAFRTCVAAAQNRTAGPSHGDRHQDCLSLLSSTNAASFLACAGPVVRCRDGSSLDSSDSNSEDDGPRGGPGGPGGHHRRSIAVAL